MLCVTVVIYSSDSCQMKQTIWFDNFHLRTSKEFKNKVWGKMRLERVEKSTHTTRK